MSISAIIKTSISLQLLTALPAIFSFLASFNTVGTLFLIGFGVVLVATVVVLGVPLYDEWITNKLEEKNS